MPDRETAIIAHRKHDVPAIIRRTRMSGTLAQFTGIEDGIHLVAKLTRSRIKTNLADIILDILVTARDRLCSRRAEIERLAIRREYRISLIMVFRDQERIQYQFMGCRFIDKDIRCLVKDFDAFILHGMETLMSGIGTIGAILARRMPVRINHRTLQGIILRLQPLPLAVLRNQGSTMVTTHMEGKLVWIYVTNIDVNYQGVVEARKDIFAKEGLTADTHYIASTGIGGATPVRHAAVAIDFLTIPHIKEEDKKYLQALDHLNSPHEYGIAFERGTRLTLPTHTLHSEGSQQFKQQYFISGTASIDKHGDVVYEGDIVRQTGRLLENIGALLKDGDATMNDIQYFIIYLRDISDYHTVDRLMQQFYPQIPRIIVEAKVCRPGWLIEMECIAEKESYSTE